MSDYFHPSTPRPCYLVNLATAEQIEAQFNPTKLDREIPVRWKALDAPGFTSSQLQYGGTGSQTFAMDLMLFSDINEPTTAPTLLEDQLKALEALCYPVANTQAPPDVLFVWPKIARVIGKIQIDKISYVMFKTVSEWNVDKQRNEAEARPRQVIVSIKITETYSTRLTSDIIRVIGPFRADQPG